MASMLTFTSVLSHSLRFAAVGLIALVTVTGCSEKKAPKNPESGDARGAQTGTETQSQTSTSTDTSTARTEATDLGISLADESNDLTYEPDSALTVEFKIEGADGHDVAVGFVERPSGAELAVSGDSVTLTWDAPTEGAHDVKLLVRDLDACKDEESDESECDVDTDAATDPKSYDAVSRVYTLKVGDVSDDPSDTNDPSGGSNSNLIKKILGLLGGAGGGGIEDLLAGLSNGQLKELLGKLQNGGGGFDIQTILDLLGGLSLDD